MVNQHMPATIGENRVYFFQASPQQIQAEDDQQMINGSYDVFYTPED